MELKGVSQYIVDEESAAPNIQDVERGCIQEDHVHMCQFEDESTPGFSLVSEGIQRYASEAPEIIQRRWVKEKDSQRSRREAEIEKLLGGPSQGILRNRSGKPEDGATSKRSATRVAPFKVNTTLASRRDGYYIVPRQRVKDFIGRETQLQEITSRFSQESTQQPKVVILHALGGQGKSQIALEYCQRSRKEYRGIFWINASSEALALQSYSQIIRVLHGTSKGFVGDEDSLIDKVKDVLECWSEQWLLVFDNYDDSKKFPRVQKFLPNSEHGHVLFTSRHRGLSRLGSLVEIPAMHPEEGVELLLRGYDHQDNRDTLASALKTVERLGGLALAIDQAAAYIQYRQIPTRLLGDFLDIYEARRRQILSYYPEAFWEYGTVHIDGEEERNRAVNAFTTWELSLEQLTNDNPNIKNEMIHLLTISAVFNPAKIEEWLFVNYWRRKEHSHQKQWISVLATKETGSGGTDSDDAHSHNKASENHDQDNEQTLEEFDGRTWDFDRFWVNLRKLYDFSIIQSLDREVQGAVFSLHPLIRDWLQLRTNAELRQKYISECFEILLDSAITYNADLPTSLEQRLALLSHVNAGLSNDERLSEPQNRLGNVITSCNTAESLARFIRNQGRLKESSKLFRRVVNTKIEALGAEHPSTLESRNDLAQSLIHQGLLYEAEQLLQQCLQSWERVSKNEHLEKLKAMRYLGTTLRRRCKHEEAEEIFRRTLQLQESILGKEDKQILWTKSELAFTISLTGKHDEAEHLLRQTSHLTGRALGKEHEDTAVCMVNLATLLVRQKKYDEAEQLYFQSLHINRKLLGAEHPYCGAVMYRLGTMYHEQGKLDKAEGILRPALQIDQNGLGREHPDTLDSMYILAKVLRARGKSEEAGKLDEERLQIEQNRDKSIE